jgi:hypothetical protein
MVKCCVFFAVRTEFLNIIWTSFGFMKQSDLPNIISVIKSRGMRWAGHIARVEMPRNAYNIFVAKLGGKRPLGRLRGKWEDNIK